MTRKLSVAVMSDLHFVANDDEQKISYIDLSKIRSDKQDPIRDLYKVIEQQGLRADILMCPGDITVGACKAGLNAAWAALQETKGMLGAEYIFAATGNHDIVSRDGKTEPEIWERLKQLKPLYPSPNAPELEQLRYWADHFSIVKINGLRIVTLNTCNSHSRGVDEYTHGRVTDFTIQRIIERLDSDDKIELNILLCHHHPIRYADLNQQQQDYSEMVQGQKLVDELSRTNMPWIIIHGHKHYPKLSYAGGASNAPTIFSAGSLSAILAPVYFSTAVNQFYIMDLDLDDIKELGGVGVIRSWDWVKSVGWTKAEYAKNTPGKIVDGSGFGNHINITSFAAKIVALLAGQPYLSWSDVCAQFPDIRYMLFDDRIALLDLLATRHKIRALGASPLDPVQLVRD